MYDYLNGKISGEVAWVFELGFALTFVILCAAAGAVLQ